MKQVWKLFTRLSPLGLGVLVVVDVLVGVVFRFSTTSKLWLDEALGVNIAQGSPSQIVERLRNDGAPPLYYLILHYWMKVFGTSDFAVRALSGVAATLVLGAVFLLARRLWGLKAGFLALSVVAVIPYAVYFGTETRMYALVMLESTTLLYLWVGDWTRHTKRRIALTAVAATALLYTHYWALYFLFVLGVTVLAQIVASRSLSSENRLKLLALAAGFVAWLPWFPIFNEQRIHTGTPWATPPPFYQFLTWLDGIVTNQSRQHVTTSLHSVLTPLCFIAILVLGLFALRMHDRAVIELDVRVPREVRFIAFVGLGTVVVGMTAAHFGSTTFVPRYAAVAVIPVLLIAVRGIQVLDKTWRILLVLFLISGLSLWTDRWGRIVQRTQAGQVAAVLDSAPAGSYVFFCPDQLGPSTMRYSRPDVTYKGYPRYDSPQIVNWYDYKQAFGRTSPQAAGRFVAKDAGPRDIYIVWASGYTLKNTCRSVVNEVAVATGRSPEKLLKAKLTGFYQSMNVTYFGAP